MSDEKVKFFGINFSDEEIKIFRQTRIYQYLIDSWRKRAIGLSARLDDDTLSDSQVHMTRGRAAEVRDMVNILTYLIEDSPNANLRHSKPTIVTD